MLELRVDTEETVGELKETLYTYNGTRIEFMQLSLLDGDRLVGWLLTPETASFSACLFSPISRAGGTLEQRFNALGCIWCAKWLHNSCE